MSKSARELKEKFFRWGLGRLSDPLWGNYYKMLLLRLSKLEIHLLKIPKGTKVRAHVDVVSGFKHHRVNVVLKRPKYGGHFYRSGGTNDDRRIIYFRPDIQVHGMTRVHSGDALILSIGWTT